jgi:hypothetical protein
MISTAGRDIPAFDLDQILHSVLHDIVDGEEPSARVREWLLRICADGRQPAWFDRPGANGYDAPAAARRRILFTLEIQVIRAGLIY